MTARKRTRGAQPGNQNAQKHGFYSKALSPDLRKIYEEALKIDGVDQELALLRTRILPTILRDPANHHLLPYCIRLIERMIRTQRLLGTDDTKSRPASPASSLNSASA